MVVQSCSTSDDKLGRYGITPISSISSFQKLTKGDPEMSLVNLKNEIPTLNLDIRYATPNNFVNQAVYNHSLAYARKPVAEALKLVQNELLAQGLSLKIYDAYRPYSVTVKFYELYPDTNYVASPYSGSRHNRGAAVDLTIIDTLTKQELNMGTDYDDFREVAHPSYADLPVSVIQNRKMLMDLMAKHRFTVYPTEWWHYDFQNWERFELLDISFEELLQL